jgi:DNA-binding LacI/PurR family transcriptional regulator
MEPLKHKSRATSYDVARLAGVSQSAVSRCFKPGASVSKKMREKVMLAAKELNYQPNAIARGLITRRSNLVAVLVSSQMNFYYPEVLFQLTDRFSQQGMRVLLFTINEEADVEDAINQVWQYQADGIISASYLSVEQHKLLEERQIPIVMFNRYFGDLPTNTIWCDTENATQVMVKQLIDFGHKDFGLIEGPEYSMVNRERMRLVREAIAEQGGEIIGEARGNYRYESAANATQSLMAGDKRPTAIIAANDMMAMGALDELRNVMGRSVPGDISVVGFDGIGAASFASYELTTIRQPIGRMAEAAVTMMLDRIEKPETSSEKRVLAGSFIQGTSTGPVPQ